MSSNRDRADESGLGAFGDHSLEVGVDWENLPATEAGGLSSASVVDFWADSPSVDDETPDVVVFDPLGFGLAAQLENTGIPVRIATTPVEVMMLTASRPTGAVACGPAADAEKRRMLTAALRSRFPWIAVVYFSTHGRQAGALSAAKAEGAHDLVALPIPDDDNVLRLFSQYVPVRRAPAPLDDAPASPASPWDDEFAALAKTKVKTDDDEQDIPSDGQGDFGAATEVIGPMVGDGRDPPRADGFDPFSGLPPTAFDRPEPVPRGDLGELMNAISPFLWGLEDAQRFMEVHAEKGDNSAKTHAQTLKILARLLAQLQEKIDDRGL